MKCAILMATYNGEKYVKEQIDSILSQKDVDIMIYVSDDNSTDNTIKIIKDYQDKYENIILLPKKERMGSASQNFFRLIRDIDFSKSDFIAFADQDDIWKEDKLLKATFILDEKNLDAYSSSVIAFWDDGKTKIIDKSAPQKEFDFLFGSPGPGCTQVFKKSFMQSFQKSLIQHNTLSKKIELHDWVIYAYARTQGFQWWIDSFPSLDYRQHANNEFGANSGLKAFIDRWEKARNGWYGKQILYISDFCHVKHLKPIQDLSSQRYLGKLKLACHAFKLRRKKSEAIILALMLITPGFKI